jgi:hypothetical protein
LQNQEMPNTCRKVQFESPKYFLQPPSKLLQQTILSGSLKHSPKGEISPNLVTLLGGLASFCLPACPCVFSGEKVEELLNILFLFTTLHFLCNLLMFPES